jgi:hypothetical protein
MGAPYALGHSGEPCDCSSICSNDASYLTLEVGAAETDQRTIDDDFSIRHLYELPLTIFNGAPKLKKTVLR